MGQRISLEELQALLAQAEELVPKGTTYRHYRDNKGEKVYTVVGHAVLESDESIQVLYQSSEHIVFSRKLSEFIESVRAGTQKRFQKL
jgi:hypothetical protein